MLADRHPLSALLRRLPRVRQPDSGLITAALLGPGYLLDGMLVRARPPAGAAVVIQDGYADRAVAFGMAGGPWWAAGPCASTRSRVELAGSSPGFPVPWETPYSRATFPWVRPSTTTAVITRSACRPPWGPSEAKSENRPALRNGPPGTPHLQITAWFSPSWAFAEPSIVPLSLIAKAKL
jgi:hypothetical protein